MPHMPSSNPRLSVVLTPSLAATLSALSDATGDSASSIVRGLLVQSEPALHRMLKLVVAASSAKGQINAGVADSLKRVVDDLEDQMALADSRMGRAVRDLVEQAEVVSVRKRAGGAGGAAARAARPVVVGSTPVPVTRGSGTGKTRKTRGGRGSV